VSPERATKTHALVAVGWPRSVTGSAALQVRDEGFVLGVAEHRMRSCPSRQCPKAHSDQSELDGHVAGQHQPPPVACVEDRRTRQDAQRRDRYDPPCHKAPEGEVAMLDHFHVVELDAVRIIHRGA
jgi:hypothetical protein